MDREPMDLVRLNLLSEQILGGACAVHTALGPGLLEAAYEACLQHELQARGLAVQRQLALPVVYRDCRVDAGFRLDLLVEDEIIIEVKAVGRLAPIHRAQLLTYLRLSGRHVGLLLNFNVERLKDGGIARLVQGVARQAPSPPG